jgi:uncharacterized membrane protein YphA (DoxX/SURF4 family)
MNDVTSGKPVVGYLLIVVRIFLGLFLIVNGLNMWFNWLGNIKPDSVPANALMDGLVFSGLFSFVKYIEVLTGLMLLVNRWVPLALVLMLPLTMVIIFVDFGLIRSQTSYTFGSLLTIPHFILLFANMRAYLPMLAMRHRANGFTAGELKSALLKAD